MASTDSAGLTVSIATATERGDLPVRLAWGLTLLVVSLGLVVELLYHEGWGGSPPRVLELLSLSAEGNVPTWWSSLLAAACAGELARIARASGGAEASLVRGFWALSVGFLCISCDEVAQLHEDLGLLVEGEGLFYFGWVKFAIALVVALAIGFVPFLRALPAEVRRPFLLTGALYVAGAVGMELPLGLWVDAHGSENLGYSLIDWVEETMEIVALTAFLTTLRARRGALTGGE